jgi:predicted ribosome quality control (RQC) complex YloA/Tae2 family protein
MQIDALTLAAVADEWRSLLIGARIDTVIQPTEHAIAIQCYAPPAQDRGGQNHWLYLSAHPQLARAHLTALKPARISSEPPPFVMLLRKHLEGSRIESVAQPRWERMLEIVAGYRSSASPESDERIRFRLIVEIMGRFSNIILCDEQGMILGCLRRVGAEINRYRVIAPGVAYVPPPSQQRTVVGQSLPRLEPATITAAQLALSAAEETAAAPEPATAKKRRAPEQPTLWRLLTHHVLGFSPQLAREAVYRATEDAEAGVERADEGVWEELAWNVRDLASLYESRRWQPQIVERIESGEQGNEAPNGGQGTAIAIASYALEQYAAVPDIIAVSSSGSTLHSQPGRSHLEEVDMRKSERSSVFAIRIRRSASINELLDEAYAQAEWRDAMDSVRAPIRKILQTQIERCKRKADLLRQEMTSSEEAARYRLQGELLLAQQQEVAPGQSSVTLQNVFEGEEGAMVTIPLDPRFDAVSNANRLFNKYHKLRRALTLVPGQIEQNDAELATLEQFMADLLLAETPAEVALVKAEVQAAGYIRGKALLDKRAMKAAKKGKGGKQAKGKPVPPGGGVPLHVQSRDGFTLLIGKNSRQNEEVTFHQAVANDIWLHARGVPGAHVIIKAAGREIPRSTIEQAARLAAYYSQARGSTTVPVDYTLQRHVRHMKGGGPGMVTYERERTIYAVPQNS